MIKHEKDKPLLAPKSILRPRDLRLSKKKDVSSFSRTSAGRASLGTTSYAWIEAAERIEDESSFDMQSSTTWPRQKQNYSIATDDLMLDYNESLLKKAKMVLCEGPFSLRQTRYIFQAIFDTAIKRYWGLRIAKTDLSLHDQLTLPANGIIVRVNENNLLCKSSDEAFSILANAFSKPQVTAIALIKQEDLPNFVLKSDDFLCNNDDSSIKSRNSYFSGMSPISYIKNLNAFNTRSIGQRICVDLHKLSEGGFGISFGTRDTFINTEEMQPVFLERIMPTGAAIHDGRLQFGDRLLSINGVQVTNFKNAMSTLRSIPVGSKATMVFSRQDSVVVKTSSTLTTPPHNLNDLTGASSSTPDFVFESPLRQTIFSKIEIPHPESGTSSLGIRFEAWSEPRIIHAYSEFDGSDATGDQMVGDVDNLEEHSSGLFIKQTSIDNQASKGSIAGSLKPGDQLVAVNDYSVIGLPPAKISTLLEAAINRAQEKMLRKKKRMFLKLTVNRFFYPLNKQESCLKTKSILRSVTDIALEKSLVKNNRESSQKKGNVINGKLSDDASDITQRRLARTPSIDLRGRSRRERGSNSPSESPARSQSALTRDGMGRRSVSEKRHAHLSACNFSHFNENILPFRNKGDEQSSRLYSTMPASRKIRQIRRSKQGRSSGPIKPVHSEELMDTTAPAKVFPFQQNHRRDSSDIIRTDAVDECHGVEGNSMSGLIRSRSHNHSFRAAVNPESHHRAPPPAPSKPNIDGNGFPAASPPVPARRPKVAPPTRDFSLIDETGKSSSPSPLSSTSSQPPVAATQHKAFEEFMQLCRSDKKDVYHLSSSQKGSLRSYDEEKHPINLSITKPSCDTIKPIILTGVRSLPSEFRKTPSPVDFNAYTAEQNENAHSLQTSSKKAPSNFLEEVETYLPKRRIGRINDTPQAEELSCTTSDPIAMLSRRNTPSPSISHDGYTTIPKIAKRKSDISNTALPHHQAFPATPAGVGNRDISRFPMLLPNTRTNGVNTKSDSPHAIVRSRSPPIVHFNEPRSSCSGSSNTIPSDRPQYNSHSLNRPTKQASSLHHRISLTSNSAYKEN